MKTAMGTPQVRWREMHQSGRPSTIERIRLSPQAGIHWVASMAAMAPLRKPLPSMAMNHCGVARKIKGVL